MWDLNAKIDILQTVTDLEWEKKTHTDQGDRSGSSTESVPCLSHQLKPLLHAFTWILWIITASYKGNSCQSTSGVQFQHRNNHRDITTRGRGKFALMGRFKILTGVYLNNFFEIYFPGNPWALSLILWILILWMVLKINWILEKLKVLSYISFANMSPVKIQLDWGG